jgi:hypothetical protein
MAQRRKKVTSFQKQKLAKAHHRNEFIRKLKYVISTINGKEGSSIIPETIFDNLYNTRLHSFKIVVPDEYTVPSGIINDARQIISGWAKKEKIIIIPDKLEVTLDEFFTVVLTISINLDRFLPDELSLLHPLKKKLKKFNIALENVYEKAADDIYAMLLILAFYYNDIGKILYCFKHEIVPTPGLEGGIINLISFNTYALETSSVEIDNNPRPVIRMGYTFPNYGIEWITIKPSVLNMDNPFADIPLDVYIQTHALLRLSERIDCFLTGSLHYNMFISFKDPKVFYDSNHNILIEYRYFGMKAGYFRLDIIEGKIVIRTFLFVTNTGTPEGLMLENITGLRKLDKKYLAIDKLSTFMTSDIGNNEKVRKIFTSAGCQCLLDLYEKSNRISTNSSNHFDADLMLKYIGYDKEHLPESIQHESLFRTQPA